jgi:hypothetical protein
MNYNCLICDRTQEKSNLRFTCRCREGHAICSSCGEDLTYEQAQVRFGPQHYIDDKNYDALSAIQRKKEYDKLFDKLAYDEFRKVYRECTMDNGVIDFDLFTEKFKGYKAFDPSLLMLYHEKELKTGRINYPEETRIYDPKRESGKWHHNSEAPWCAENGYVRQGDLVFHKIRPVENTVLSLVDKDGDVFITKVLEKDRETVINYWKTPLPYSGHFYFKFDPPVDFDYQILDYMCPPDEDDFKDRLPKPPQLYGLSAFLVGMGGPLSLRTLMRSCMYSRSLGIACIEGELHTPESAQKYKVFLN